MITWLNLDNAQRKISLEQAAIKSGIKPEALEKDWWVTLILKALFELEYAEHFIFKGGTSLSKGFGLIQRFSEDIDIALNPIVFGYEYTDQPTHSYVKKTKKAGCKFTSEHIKNALTEKLTSYGVIDKVNIVVEEVNPTFPDKDPQTIYVNFRSLFAPNPYITPGVKIEFSVRSLREPFYSVAITSLLHQHFPNKAYNEIPFHVPTAAPEKTLIEKMCLLHERFHGPQADEKEMANRHSRHLSDIGEIASKGLFDSVLADPDLLTAVIEHRRNWIRVKGIDYDMLYPETLSFVPTDKLMAHYEADYAVMRSEMIYGNPPDFSQLLEQLRGLNKKLSTIYSKKNGLK